MSPGPWAELDALHRMNGYGMVGGVELDFRHSEIDENWHVSGNLGSDGPKFALNTDQPVLTFPWSASPTDATASENDDGISLEHGDKLFIRSVDRVPVEGVEFEGEPNAEVLEVRYGVERPDRQIVDVRGYSWYVHRDRDRGDKATWVGGDSFDDRFSLEAVERSLGLLLRPNDLDEHGEPTANCEINAGRCRMALAEIESLPPTGAWRDRALVKVGYFLARAEAAVHMLHYAKSGIASDRGGSRGGRVSGDARRLAAKQWEPQALALAKKVRSGDSGVSQRNLASDVRDDWVQGGAKPSFDGLLAFIRRAEADGSLPRRLVPKFISRR